MRAPVGRLAFLIALLAVASVAFFTLRGPAGLQTLREREAQIEALERSNQALAKEIERKREHIRRLADNPAQQELEIRDRLKLVHPNEKVYIIGEPDKKPPAR